MENLIQVYLPLAALLITLVNGSFLKKSFINWLPLVLILAGLSKFLGDAVISDGGEVPSIIKNGIISILIITTFIALSHRQFLKDKGRKFQFLTLGLIYGIAIGVALAIKGDFTSGLTVFNGPKLILGVVLNALMLAVIYVKFPYLLKWFKLNAQESYPTFYKAILSIIIALSIYLGVFVSGWYGVAFFAAIFLPTLIVISTKENEEFLQSAAISIVAVLLIGFIYSFGTELQFEIGQSHLVWGVFIGIFLIALGSFQGLIEKNSKAMTIVISAVVLGMVFGLGYLYNIKENLGGLITYAGILIGIAVAIFNYSRKEFSFPINNALIILSSIMLFTPVFEVKDPFGEKGSNADKLESDQKKVEVVNEKGEKVVLELNDITEAVGKYEIFLDNSKLKFIVVSHGNKTKGTFKNYSGSVLIAEKLEDCEVNIEFDATSFSTFNKTRDKELKNESMWMDVDNFPKVNYTAKGFKLEGDKYVAEGELTMKGISKKLKVSFVFDGKGNNDGKDFVIISGNVELEMTDFGIEESSEVDKGVSVEFTIEANKIE